MNPCRATDVQLEFVMLDPYVRTTLKHNGKVFNSTIHIPLRKPCHPRFLWATGTSKMGC